MSTQSIREWTIWNTLFQVLVQRCGIVYPTVIVLYLNSQFKDIVLNQQLDILIQENTYVAVHTLVEIFRKY